MSHTSSAHHKPEVRISSCTAQGCDGQIGTGAHWHLECGGKQSPAFASKATGKYMAKPMQSVSDLYQELVNLVESVANLPATQDDDDKWITQFEQDYQEFMEMETEEVSLLMANIEILAQQCPIFRAYQPEARPIIGGPTEGHQHEHRRIIYTRGGEIISMSSAWCPIHECTEILIDHSCKLNVQGLQKGRPTLEGLTTVLNTAVQQFDVPPDDVAGLRAQLPQLLIPENSTTLPN